MGRWNSRRAGPEHPMLFVHARDIPVPVEPPRPQAGAALEPFQQVLGAAEAEPLALLGPSSLGRSVVAGGERRRPDPVLGGDALLDDGGAVLPLRLPARAPRALRDRLSARFVLVRGTLREHEGHLALEVDEAVDLRELARLAPGSRR